MTDARLDEALRQLFSFSLAKRTAEGSSFSIHPLVHTWARERLDEEHKMIMAREAIRLLGEKLAISGQWKRERNIKPHLVACVENAITNGALQPLIVMWKGHPYVPAWTTKLVNFGILQLHRYPDHAFVRLLDEIALACDGYRHHCAKDLRQLTVAWSINILSIDDFWTLRRMTSLGETLHLLEELEEATSWILHALRRHEKVIRGPGQRDTILSSTLNNVARVIAKLRPSHTHSHHATLRALGHIGMTLVDRRKRFDEAEKLFKRALEGFENFLGPDHLDTLQALHYLAVTVGHQERFEEAEGSSRLLLQKREYSGTGPPRCTRNPSYSRSRCCESGPI